MPASSCPAPKIALVIDRFDGRRGGAALWTRGFAAWLAARECDVHVLARTIGPAEARLPITFHPLSVGKSPLAFAGAASDRLAEIGPLVSHDMGVAVGCDVFQPHFGSGLACWQGSVDSYPPWQRPIKQLCGLSPRYRRLRRLCISQFAGGSAAFIAVSHKVAHDMQALHQAPAQRIRVIHNGVDLRRFTPTSQHEARLAVRRHFGLRDEDVVVIAVAHHFRLKGVPKLLQAVEQLRNEGNPVKLFLFGKPLRNVGAAIRRRGDIVKCGSIADVAPFYAAADVCVHPTHYDACSLVTLEAMAAGLPVVTTRANGASELIVPGQSGVVLDRPPIAAALAAAMRPLVRDAQLRQRLGAAAQHAVKCHSVEQNYHQIALAYAEVLAARAADVAALDRLFTPIDQPRKGRRRFLKALRGTRLGKVALPMDGQAAARQRGAAA